MSNIVIILLLLYKTPKLIKKVFLCFVSKPRVGPINSQHNNFKRGNIFAGICTLVLSPWGMDKLQLTGQNLGWDFNFRKDYVQAMHFLRYILKLPKLKLKTQPKWLSGSLPLDIALPTKGHLMGDECLICFLLCQKSFFGVGDDVTSFRLVWKQGPVL